MHVKIGTADDWLRPRIAFRSGEPVAALAYMTSGIDQTRPLPAEL